MAADPGPHSDPLDPPEGEEGPRGAGGPGPIQEVLKKALMAGVGALFMTEEGARRLAREWKLPKELLGSLGAQAQGAKDELLRVFSDEMRRFLESEAVRREFVKALSSMVVEVKAEIRVRPAGEQGPPVVKAEVKARTAKKGR